MSDEQEPQESGPAWAPQDPYAGDPPPAGQQPGEQQPGEQQSGGYGAPQSGGYGAPQSGGYGSAPPGGYGYGTPAPPPAGSPQGGYGPSDYGYGAPQQGPQGPQQTPYGGGPPQAPYGGQPSQPPYGGQPSQAPYGAPQQSPYGGAPQPPQPGAPGYGGGPGGPGSGWMPSYPPAPTPTRQKNNKPLIIGGIAAGAAVLLLAALVIVLTTGGKDDKTTNPPTVAASNSGAAGAAQAAQSLGAVPALRYNGTFSSGGDDFQAQLSVTKAGSAVGAITVGGNRADLVSVDGNTYLKAPKAFWRDQGGVTTNPEDYAGRWAKAPDSAMTLDIKNVLAAGAIVKGLQSISSYQPASGTQDVGGTPAVKVTGADAEYYLSTANPPKLLRIVGTGTDTYQFDVAEVSATEVAALFQQLRSQVSALNGARDPSVRFLPTAKIKASNCGLAGCTMKLTVTTVSIGGSGSGAGGGSGQIRAIMFGKITAGGRTGRTLGTCSDSASTSSGKRVNLSCTVRGGAWSSWVRGIRGRASYYVQARTVAESSEAGNLLSAVDQEQRGA